MSNVMDIINSRSSIRKYTDEPVSEELCRKLIEAGLKAPTAANKQEIHFTVTKGIDPVQKEIQNDLNPDANVTFHYDAPLVIYLSGRDDFKWSAVDAGIAVENIHLAAADLGLGSVILGCMERVLNGEKKAYYDKKLAFPEGYSYLVAIAVGHPAAGKEPHTFDFDQNVSIL